MILQSCCNWRVLFVLSLCTCVAFPAIAQDDKSEKAKDKTEDKAEEKAEEKKEDPYAIPEGASLEELQTFLKSLKRPRTAAQAAEYYGATVKATTLIMEKADGKDAAKAAEQRLSALLILPRADKKYDGESASDFAKTLLEDDREEVMLVGRIHSLTTKAGRAAGMKPEKRNEMIEEIFGLIKTQGATRKTLGLARSVAKSLSRSPKTVDESGKIYERIAPMFASAEDEAMHRYGPKMEGAARRVRLVGNPIELEGLTEDGSEFDWANYKGKVVLVDFWATWCGPCVREIPNMKKNYAAYQDRGFEIVGINMDRAGSQKKVDSFLEKYELPWNHIMGTKEANGWDHPLATHYGVMSIPTQMLVGRDGNVISLSARGSGLDRQLEELLGPAKEKSDDTEEKEEGEKEADSK